MLQPACTPDLCVSGLEPMLQLSTSRALAITSLVASSPKRLSRRGSDDGHQRSARLLPIAGLAAACWCGPAPSHCADVLILNQAPAFCQPSVWKECGSWPSRPQKHVAWPPRRQTTASAHPAYSNAYPEALPNPCLLLCLQWRARACRPAVHRLCHWPRRVRCSGARLPGISTLEVRTRR